MRAAPQERAARLLRYRFDAAGELRRHCRVVDGRVLLFFPDPDPALVFGRTMLELSFAKTGQQVVVPALVHARASGAQNGLWLELRALSVVAGLQSAMVGPRRESRRLAVDLVAYIRGENGPVYACPIIDVGAGGARVWGLPEDQRGPLMVRIPDWPTLRAEVVWSRGRESGIHFALSTEAAARMFARIETMWDSARVATHRGDCPCARGGELNEPAVPRLALAGGLR